MEPEYQMSDYEKYVAEKRKRNDEYMRNLGLTAIRKDAEGEDETNGNNNMRLSRVNNTENRSEKKFKGGGGERGGGP